jgi:hypothetical protein
VKGGLRVNSKSLSKEHPMKRLAVVFLAVLCATAVLPQSGNAAGLGFGVKVGYAWSSFFAEATAEVPSFQVVGGATAGAFIRIGSGLLTFEPEVLYVRMGAQYDADPTTRFQFYLDYVQVPVLVKLNFVPGGTIRPFISGGAYGSFLVNTKGRVLVNGAVIKEENVDNLYEDFDAGLVGGLGLGVKFPRVLVSFEARYNYGLLNIMTAPEPGSSLRNSCWTVLAGVAF